uniref:GSKIP domain-containing protein n=1 Tax=Globodera rostochiensis TaxID=31243 RepID=A0A914H7N4_GLORO
MTTKNAENEQHTMEENGESSTAVNRENTNTGASSPTSSASCECKSQSPGRRPIQFSVSEKDAFAAVREMAPFVTTISISELLPRTPELLFLNIVTLENESFCVELTQRGWRVCADRLDCMNADFHKLDMHVVYYETQRLVPNNKKNNSIKTEKKSTAVVAIAHRPHKINGKAVDASVPSRERGVVWEETLILLPQTTHLVFLSATIPMPSSLRNGFAIYGTNHAMSFIRIIVLTTAHHEGGRRNSFWQRSQATLLYTESKRKSATELQAKAFGKRKREPSDGEDDDNGRLNKARFPSKQKCQNPKALMPWRPSKKVVHAEVRNSVLSSEDHRNYVAILQNMLKSEPTFRFEHDMKKIKLPITADNDLRNFAIQNDIEFVMDGSTLGHLLSAPYGHKPQISYAYRVSVQLEFRGGKMRRVCSVFPPIIASRMHRPFVAREYFKWAIKLALRKNREQKTDDEIGQKKKFKTDESSAESLLNELQLGQIGKTASGGSSSSADVVGKRYAIVTFDGGDQQQQSEFDQQHRVLIRTGVHGTEDDGTRDVVSLAVRPEFLPELAAEKISPEETLMDVVTATLKGSQEHITLRVHFDEHLHQLHLMQIDRKNASDLSRLSQESRKLDALSSGPVYDFAWFEHAAKMKPVFSHAPIEDYWNGIDPHYPLQWHIVRGQIPGALFPRNQRI